MENHNLSTNALILKHANNIFCLQNVTRKLILIQCNRSIISCNAVANSVWNNDPYSEVIQARNIVWPHDLRKLDIQLKVIIIILRRSTVTIVSFALVKRNKTD